MIPVTVTGRISEPKLTYTSTGKALLTFGLAVNRKVKEEQKTTWYNVKAWNELAEALASMVQKGSRLIVVGEIDQESYEKDGVTKTSTVLTARDAGVSLRYANQPPTPDDTF